jgi:hypothetical protein
MLTLTAEHEQLIQTQLATGRYANAEEVLVQRQDQELGLMSSENIIPQAFPKVSTLKLSYDAALGIALQLLTRLDSEQQIWIEETRAKIAEGIAELDDLRSVGDHRGEGVDGPTVMRRYA